MIPDSVVEAACRAWCDNADDKHLINPMAWEPLRQDHFRRMCSALEAAAPMMTPQWIRCSERMPRHDERVLAMFGSIMRTVFHDETGWHSDICSTYSTNATHWMPLPSAPQPPKESGV
jgi:hypothetical protein